MTMKIEERSGDNFSAKKADEFIENIDRVGVIDLPLSKGQWTWSNQKCSSRIDKFFVSTNLMADLARISHKTISRHTLNHFPICIEAKKIK